MSSNVPINNTTPAPPLAQAIKSNLTTVPSTAAVERVINSTQTTLDQARSQHHLSSEGATFVSELQNVTNDLRVLAVDRNRDEKLQSLVRSAGTGITQTGSNVRSSIGTGSTDSFARETNMSAMMSDIRTFSNKLLRDAQFRGAIVELFQIMRDLARQKTSQHGGVFNAMRSAVNPIAAPIGGATTTTSTTTTTTMSYSTVSATPFATPGIPAVIETVTSGMQPVRFVETHGIVQQQQQQAAPVLINQYSSVQQTTDPSTQALYDRLRLLLQRMAREPEWQRGSQSLIDLVENLQHDWNAGTGVMGAMGSQTSSHFASDAIRVIEEYSGRSTRPFLQNARMVGSQMRRSTSYSPAWNQFKYMLQEALRNPVLMDDPVWNSNFNYRFNTLQNSLREIQCSPEYSTMLDEGSLILSGISNDPTLKKLRDDSAIMVNHLTRDPVTGNFRLNTQLLHEIQTVLIPLFLQNLQNIHVPSFSERVHGPFGEYDVRVDDLVVNAGDILPSKLKIKEYNKVDMRFKNFSGHLKDDSCSYLKIKMADIFIHISNAHVHWTKVGGRMNDNMALDLHTKRRGLSITHKVALHLNPARFEVVETKTRLGGLKIRMHGGKYNMLYKLVSTLFGGTISKSVERTIALQVQKGSTMVTERLNYAAGRVPQVQVKERVVVKEVDAMGARRV